MFDLKLNPCGIVLPNPGTSANVKNSVYGLKIAKVAPLDSKETTCLGVLRLSAIDIALAPVGPCVTVYTGPITCHFALSHIFTCLAVVSYQKSPTLGLAGGSVLTTLVTSGRHKSSATRTFNRLAVVSNHSCPTSAFAGNADLAKFSIRCTRFSWKISPQPM